MKTLSTILLIWAAVVVLACVWNRGAHMKPWHWL